MSVKLLNHPYIVGVAYNYWFSIKSMLDFCPGRQEHLLEVAIFREKQNLSEIVFFHSNFQSSYNSSIMNESLSNKNEVKKVFKNFLKGMA